MGKGEESEEGGNTGRRWGDARRGERRVGTLVEDRERGGERRGWEHW